MPGTIFALADPQAAVRLLYKVFPQSKPTGKDEAAAICDDLKALQARAPKWTLQAGGVSQWGYNSEENYAAYADFLFKWGVPKEKVNAAI